MLCRLRCWRCFFFAIVVVVVVVAATECWDACGVRVQEGVVFGGEVVDEARGYAGCNGPVVGDLLGEGVGERSAGGRQDEEEVPVDVAGEEVFG